MEGIQSVFTSAKILFDIEFMNSKKINTKENYTFFYDTLTYHLEN